MTRVGVLCYGLERPLSGVTRVALELGRGLLTRPDLEVTFLTPYRRGPFVGQVDARTVYLPGCRLLPGLMLFGGPLMTLIAKARGLDVLHDPIGMSPFTLPRAVAPYRRVVSIQDAIAFEYPQGYPWLNNLLHRTYVPATLPMADVVATGSEASRRSISRYYHVAPSGIRVIPYAVSPRFRPWPPGESAAVARKHGIPGPYVLYVGAFKAHKNVVALIDAFSRVASKLPNHRFVFVGPRQWSFPEMDAAIARASLGDRLTMVGYVPEDDLPALYSAADACVLPSLHEGFGFPALEAMACGTPLICSTSSSLPEVAGDAAYMIDPHDTNAIAEAIVDVVKNQDLAARLRRDGLARAATFTWKKVASDYASLYHELAGR